MRVILNDRLREARETKGLSQEEAADLAGVHPTSWQNWESGRKSPRPYRVNRIATALEVPAEWLTGAINQIPDASANEGPGEHREIPALDIRQQFEEMRERLHALREKEFEARKELHEAHRLLGAVEDFLYGKFIYTLDPEQLGDLCGVKIQHVLEERLGRRLDMDLVGTEAMLVNEIEKHGLTYKIPPILEERFVFNVRVWPKTSSDPVAKLESEMDLVELEAAGAPALDPIRTRLAELEAKLNTLRDSSSTGHKSPEVPELASGVTSLGQARINRKMPSRLDLKKAGADGSPKVSERSAEVVLKKIQEAEEAGHDGVTGGTIDREGGSPS